MHYLRTHAGQGMADRQDRWQTGGRGTPRLSLLRQYSRRWEELLGKRGETNPDFDGDPDQNHYKWVRPTGHPAGPLARVPEH